MVIKILDRNNLPPDEAVKAALQKILAKLDKSSRLIQDALLFTTKNHFQTTYPDSKHFDPEKVTKDKKSDAGSQHSASINVDVPGITRAYHDLLIKPKFKQSLTIPIHRDAYGKKASEFTDTFIVKKRDGKAFIAKKSGWFGLKLTYLYVLAKRAFQKRDARLMPSDNTFCENISSRITASLMRTRV